LSDSALISALREALFDSSLAGIRKTGDAYPLGGFMLVGAMIDMLAGLRFAPDTDGGQGKRYADFVNEYFPARYSARNMGPKMWDGLRCRPLHNFCATTLILADSQPDSGLHFQVDTHGRVCLHWPEFLADYEVALTRYWDAVASTLEVRENALRRCRKYPPMTATRFAYGGMTFPMTFPLSFGGTASGYAGPSPS
jgi:hypothetical protein